MDFIWHAQFTMVAHWRLLGHMWHKHIICPKNKKNSPFGTLAWSEHSSWPVHRSKVPLTIMSPESFAAKKKRKNATTCPNLYSVGLRVGVSTLSFTSFARYHRPATADAVETRELAILDRGQQSTFHIMKTSNLRESVVGNQLPYVNGCVWDLSHDTSNPRHLKRMEFRKRSRKYGDSPHGQPVD